MKIFLNEILCEVLSFKYDLYFFFLLFFSMLYPMNTAYMFIIFLTTIKVVHMEHDMKQQ